MILNGRSDDVTQVVRVFNTTVPVDRACVRNGHDPSTWVAIGVIKDMELLDVGSPDAEFEFKCLLGSVLQSVPFSDKTAGECPHSLNVSWPPAVEQNAQTGVGATRIDGHQGHINCNVGAWKTL
jgi:hypothetical protein